MKITYSDPKINIGWNKEEAALMAEFFNNNKCSTYIDVGLNNGKFHKEFRKLVTPALDFAYEPSPIISQALKRLSKFTDITFFTDAVSEKSGELEFFFSPAHHETSSLIKENVAGRKQSIKINSINYQEFIERHKGHDKIHLKVDTEGFDLRILTNVLGSLDVKVIHFELLKVDDEYRLARELLVSLGFILPTIDELPTEYDHMIIISDFSDCSLIVR